MSPKSSRVTSLKIAPFKPSPAGLLQALSETIAAISQTASTAQGLESIYPIALNSLHQAIGVERASILFFDPDGVMRFKAWLGISSNYRKKTEGHTPWPPGTQDATPLVIPDVQEDSTLASLLPVFVEEDIRALAFIPLLHQRTVIGKFMLYSRVPYSFQREIEFASTLGNLIAFAVVRVKDEREIRAKEELFRATFDFSAIGKALISVVDGRLTRVNKKLCEIVGYHADELLTKTIFDITHPLDQQNTLETFLRLRHGQFTYIGDKRYVKKDGTTVWTTVNTSSIRDESRQVVSLVTAVLDITDRKATEEEKQVSLRKYAELVDSIDGIVWEANPSFEFTFVSKRAEIMLGYPIEEWKKPGFWPEHLHPEDRIKTVEFCVSKSAKLENHDFEYRMFNSKGEIVWLRDIVNIVAENGKLTGLRGVMVDITSQKQAESKLRESEARKAAILESALDCIVTIDHAGRTIEFNKAAEAELGYSRRDVIGKEMASFLIPERQREAHRKGLSHFIETGEGPILGKRIEMEALKADGSLIPVELAITRIPSDGPPLFTGFIRNISESKKARETLKSANEELEKRVIERTLELTQMNTFLTSLFDNIPNMLFVKDAKDLRFVRFNRAGEELTGFSKDEFIGKNDYDFFPKAEADFFTSKDRAVLQSRSSADIPEEPIQTRTQGIRLLHTKKIPLYDAQGEPQYLVGVSEDITDRKRAEEDRIRLAQEREGRMEAEKAIQTRDDFLAIASHELRTPLTPMRMYLQLGLRHLDALAEEIPKADFLRKAIQGANQELDRFLKLVENLLDVSRIHAGRLTLDRRQINLSELVQEIAERFKDTFKNAGCELTLNLGEKVIGYWDRNRLEQVIINLLTNATKYGAGKPVEATVTKTKDLAVLRVRDHGIGISKENQGKLFQRFERVAPLRHYGGFGLGLFISREIIAAHQGRVWVESELGKGSTFVVELPFVATTPPA